MSYFAYICVIFMMYVIYEKLKIYFYIEKVKELDRQVTDIQDIR